MAYVRIPVANIKGPEGDKGDKGDPGLPGSNAASNDSATGTYVATPGTATDGALRTGYVRADVPASVASMTEQNRGKVNQNAATVLAPFWARLAARSTSRVNVCWIGDSIVAGFGASQHLARMADRVTAAFRAQFPLLGNPVYGGRGFIPPIATATTLYTWPCVMSGNASVGSTLYGPARTTIGLQTTGKLVYSLNGTEADIMYVKLPSGGSFRYRVDAGAWTTVSNVDTVARDGHRVEVVLGAAGAHTLEIEAVTTGAYIDGVIEYNNDRNRGVMVHACGHGGWKAADWVGGNPNGLEHWPGGMLALSPDLFLIALGTNEEAQAATTTFQADMTAFLVQMRAVGFTQPIVLVIFPAGNGVTAASHKAIIDGTYAAAATDPKTLVCDLSARSVGYQADMFVDNLHPNDIGQQARADLIFRFLSPS